jgi:phosphoribosylpyrophosphate synthetase
MKLVAQMLVKAGLTHLITVDLHQKEIQGFFDIPVDNLRASSFLLDYIQQQVKTKIINLYIQNIFFRFLIGVILSL